MVIYLLFFAVFLALAFPGLRPGDFFFPLEGLRLGDLLLGLFFFPPPTVDAPIGMMKIQEHVRLELRYIYKIKK